MWMRQAARLAPVKCDLAADSCAPWFHMDSLISRITIDPAVCHGKPSIRGLRYPVHSMLEYLAAGDFIEDVIAESLDGVSSR